MFDSVTPPATLPTAIALGLTDEETAYLSLLFSRAGREFDLSQVPIDTDGDGFPNVVDDDIDGDGLPNSEDADVDGDGIPNDEDDDVDDDGISNDDDEDIDGDGVENDADPDADGDGLSDRWDLDDDGDGEPDDEDEDDQDDEPKSRLEDLVDAVASRGWLTDAEQERIAREIAARFDDFDEVIALYALLDRAERLNEQPGRPAPASGFARDINAVDELYKLLDPAIEEAKRGQFNPDGPIANNRRLKRALASFKRNAEALVTGAEVFGAVRLEEISDGITDLDAGLGPNRLAAFVDGIGVSVPPTQLGRRDAEQREWNLFVTGGSRLGSAFHEARADDVLAGISVLRTLATPEGGEDVDEKTYEQLLERVEEQAEDRELADVIAQVVEEEEQEDDQEDP